MAADEPTLQELLSLAMENRLLEVHTSIPGIVVSYDPATQTADVQPAVQRADPTSDDDVRFTEPPIVPHVPVGLPCGGGFYVALPIKKGDSVWLVFSETATGPHRATGEVSVPGDLRRHSFASALAIPCNPISKRKFADVGSSTEGVVIVPGGGTFRISKAGGTADFVALAGKVDAELASMRATMNALITAYNAHVHVLALTAGTGTAAPPASPASPGTDPGSVASSTLKAD